MEFRCEVDKLELTVTASPALRHDSLTTKLHLQIQAAPRSKHYVCHNNTVNVRLT
jgi:hypothetical protein